MLSWTAYQKKKPRGVNVLTCEMTANALLIYSVVVFHSENISSYSDTVLNGDFKICLTIQWLIF